MSYVLIVMTVFSAGYSPATFVNTAEFASLTSCQYAAKVINERARQATAFCVVK